MRPSNDRSNLSSLVSSYFLPLLKKRNHTDVILPSLHAQLGQWVNRSGPLCIPAAPIASPKEYWTSVALHVPLLAKIALIIFQFVHPKQVVKGPFLTNLSCILICEIVWMMDRRIASGGVPVTPHLRDPPPFDPVGTGLLHLNPFRL